MIFKKFIGALTALVMTMTAFVGLATEVGAVEFTYVYKYILNFMYGNIQIDTMNNLDYNDAIPYINGKVNLTLDNGEYAGTYSIASYTPSGNPSSVGTVDSDGNIIITITNTYAIQVEKLQKLTVNTTGAGSGTVSVAGATPVTTESPDASSDNADETVKRTEIYTAAAGTDLTINVNSGGNSYIESKTIDGVDNAVWNGTEQLAYTTITMPEGDVTLNVGFGRYYSITQSTPAPEGGTFSLSQNTAKSGETITVHTNVAAGYELGTITVTPTDSGTSENNIEVTTNGNEGTFVMPDYDVTVAVAFKGMLPYTVAAEHIDDFDEFTNDTFASLWSGTLTGRGYAFKPQVTVTLNDANASTQTAVGSTTVSGNSLITIAVVVDKLKEDISSVQLSGVEQNTQGDDFTIQTPEPSSPEDGEPGSTDDSGSHTEDGSGEEE